MFVVDLTAPPDLQGTNEERVSAYVLDIRDNGNWVCPTDAAGKLISKPPLYAWLAALFSYLTGTVDMLSLRLPSVASLFITAVALYHFGHSCFGRWAGFFAAVTFVMSPAVVSQFAGARYDVLFAATVTLTAFAALRAWTQGGSWTWFWLGAAMATLTKGPFGPVLGAAGLLAVVWEKQTGHFTQLKGTHLPGVALFLALTIGWFALAYLEWGHGLVERMVVGELVAHAVGSEESFRGAGFYKPTVTFCTDFFPWSLLAALSFWRLWRYPSAAPPERKGERFVFCWFAVGLLALSLASHHRSRLIIPLLPAAALLAGREVARLVAWRKGGVQWRTTVTLTSVFLCALSVYYYGLRPLRRDVRQTRSLREAAQLSTSQDSKATFVMHVDTPYAFQFYRGDMHPRITMDQAAGLLKGDHAVAVAVSNWDRLQERLRLETNDVSFQWPRQGKADVRIVTNQGRLEDATRSALMLGPVLVELNNVQWRGGRRGEFTVQPNATPGDVALRNTGKRPQRMRVLVQRGNSVSSHQRVLSPGDEWRLDLKPEVELQQ